MKLGSSAVSKMYLGSAAVSAAYFGGVNLLGFTSPDKYYFASNRLTSPVGTQSVSGANHFITRLYLGTAPFDSHSYRMGLPGHTNASDGTWPTEGPMTVDLNITGVAIGYSATKDPTTATFVAGTIAGSASATITVANTVGLITDDIISSGSPIPAGYHRWLQVTGNIAASNTMPTAYSFSKYTTIEGTARAGTGYSVTSAAALSYSAQPAYGPSFVVCKGHTGRMVGLIVGDSIAHGSNEQPESSLDGIRGFMSRGFETATKKTFAGNMAIPGTAPMQLLYNYPATRNGSIGRKFDLINLIAAAQGGTLPFTHIFSNHATNSVNGMSNGTVGTDATTDATTNANSNDVGTGVPWNTPSGFLTNMKAFADNVLRVEYPSVPIYMSTCITKGSTTDAFTSTTNFTANPNTLAQGFAFSASLRSDLAAGKFDGYIDTEVAAGDPGDSTKFLVHAYATTLASNYTNGLNPDDLIVTSASGLEVGDGIVIDPPGKTGSTGGSYVIKIAGTTVTLAGGRSYTALAGVDVKGNYTRDGTHPNTNLHKLMAVPVAAKLDAINSSVA